MDAAACIHLKTSRALKGLALQLNNLWCLPVSLVFNEKKNQKLHKKTNMIQTVGTNLI